MFGDVSHSQSNSYTYTLSHTLSHTYWYTTNDVAHIITTTRILGEQANKTPNSITHTKLGETWERGEWGRRVVSRGEREREGGWLSGANLLWLRSIHAYSESDKLAVRVKRQTEAQRTGDSIPENPEICVVTLFPTSFSHAPSHFTLSASLHW